MPLGQANPTHGGGGGGEHRLSRHFKYYNKVGSAQDPPSLYQTKVTTQDPLRFTKLK